MYKYKIIISSLVITMAFYLHTAEVDKARSVTRKALTTISFRLAMKNIKTLNALAVQNPRNKTL